jgi:hypothetical protein
VCGGLVEGARGTRVGDVRIAELTTRRILVAETRANDRTTPYTDGEIPSFHRRGRDPSMTTISGCEEEDPGV